MGENVSAVTSVVIPSLDEVTTIGDLLAALQQQTVDPSTFEVLIVDGGSTDGTIERVALFSQARPEMDIRVVDNPDRIIPAALNRGIEAAKGDVIIRLDAHSAPSPDYIERCLEALERTGAANAGGVWQIEPGGEGWQARSIAAAAAHPLGAGDARYRISGEAGPIDTVPFGAFRAEWLQKVGPFNESLLTNEDYEYNVRLRQAGGTVYFDPVIRSTYYARASLAALAHQYARYGYWKVRMLRLYPGSLRWRQVLPPLFVLATLVLSIAGLAWPLAWGLLAVQWGGYASILFLFGLSAAFRRRDAALLLGFPLAVTLIHMCWGGAFLWGLISGAGRRDR
ncbi:MAG: glycosyltransferase family 2 protein [Anaerolineales bacterium]